MQRADGTANGDRGESKDAEDIFPQELSEVARTSRATQDRERVDNDNDNGPSTESRKGATRGEKSLSPPTGVSPCRQTYGTVACSLLNDDPVLVWEVVEKIQ